MFSLLISILPTDRDDILDRATAAAQSMRGAKRTYALLPPSVLADVTQLFVPALVAPGVEIGAKLRVLERLRPFNLLISNVPGPARPLSCRGSAIVGYYPISQIVAGQALNITLMSYREALFAGVLVDADVALDPDRLGRHMSDELARLTAATSRGGVPG
jgi:hypothetical protein